MINSGYANRLMEILPGEFRLVNRAKSGDNNAFIELYDASVEKVYRYIHFLVPNTGVAEGLTFKVFFEAWRRLDRYESSGTVFVVWLYMLARNEINAYYHTHRTAVDADNKVTLAAKGGSFREEFQLIRDTLQSLPPDQQHVLVLKFIAGLSVENIARIMSRREEDIRALQTGSLYAFASLLAKTEAKTAAKGFQQALEDCLNRISTGSATLHECLALHPNHAAQLRPLFETAGLLSLGREIKPLPTFHAYTHSALLQYMWIHPYRPQPKPIAIPKIVIPAIRRTAVVFALLIAALLVTGTVHAQSALPGDSFYTWKRSSEKVLLALSSDPVSTDIFLANRRLSEWIAVANDPALSAVALQNYQDALSQFDTNNEQTLTRIAAMLQIQQEKLDDAGLSSPELDAYLTKAAELLPGFVPLTGPTEIVPAADSPAAAATEVPADACAPNCSDNLSNNINDGGSGNNNGSVSTSGSSNSGSGNNNSSGNGVSVGGGTTNSGSGNNNSGGNGTSVSVGGGTTNSGSGVNNSGGVGVGGGTGGGKDNNNGTDKNK